MSFVSLEGRAYHLLYQVNSTGLPRMATVLLNQPLVDIAGSCRQELHLVNGGVAFGRLKVDPLTQQAIDFSDQPCDITLLHGDRASPSGTASSSHDLPRGDS